MVEQQVADSLQPFLRQLGEALTAVANGDAGPMKALCAHGDAVSQCGFWGGVERGWAAVGERWDWVAAQFVPGPGVVTSETVFLTATAEMAYGVFLERWWGQFTSRAAPRPATDPRHNDTTGTVAKFATTRSQPGLNGTNERRSDSRLLTEPPPPEPSTRRTMGMPSSFAMRSACTCF